MINSHPLCRLSHRGSRRLVGAKRGLSKLGSLVNTFFCLSHFFLPDRRHRLTAQPNWTTALRIQLGMNSRLTTACVQKNKASRHVFITADIFSDFALFRPDRQDRVRNIPLGKDVSLVLSIFRRVGNRTPVLCATCYPTERFP